jgi:hypothetical protein
VYFAGEREPTTKAMLMQAEAEREGLRQALQGSTNTRDKLTMVLPNLMERLQRMLDDLTKATRHEIDKARSINHGLVGEKKIVLRPTANYLTAELAGDYAGLVRLAVPNIKVVAVTRIERVTRGL